MKKSVEASNSDLFLWCLRVGGSTKYVDVETVYLKMFELAPARLSWRTKVVQLSEKRTVEYVNRTQASAEHTDIPDLKKCAKAHQEAERRAPKLLVQAGDPYSRQLSVEGQQWVADHTARFEAMTEPGVIIAAPKSRPKSQILTRVEKSDLYQAWDATGAIPEEKWRLADLLRCSPDSAPSLWSARLESLRSTAFSAERTRILEFLDAMAAANPTWFGKE